MHEAAQAAEEPFRIPPRSRTFAFDWAGGYVAPFSGQDGARFVTPPAVIACLLEYVLQDRGPADTKLVDLGSGDGQICIAAAERGARALGIELSAELVASATATAAARAYPTPCQD